METLKEKITGILKGSIKIEYKPHWVHEEYHSYPYINGQENAVDDIASLIKKDYFEWEFTEWCIINVVKNRFGRYALIEGKESFITLNEVYEHWLTKVRSKQP